MNGNERIISWVPVADMRRRITVNLRHGAAQHLSVSELESPPFTHRSLGARALAALHPAHRKLKVGMVRKATLRGSPGEECAASGVSASCMGPAMVPSNNSVNTRDEHTAAAAPEPVLHNYMLRIRIPISIFEYLDKVVHYHIIDLKYWKKNRFFRICSYSLLNRSL